MFARRSIGKVPRRHRRALLAALLAATVAGMVVQEVPRRDRPALASEERPPNVLLILTDDQRADGTLEPMSVTRRWFANGGTTFDRAYATTPLCCPSRASILTGQYAHNHGVKTNGATVAGQLDQATTLQRHLDQAGYDTALFGKYLNAWDVTNDPPHFDRWAIFPGGKSRGYRDGNWNVDGDHRSISRYSTRYIAARGQEFIEAAEQNDGQPWFLAMFVYAPHNPYLPEARYRNAIVPVPAAGPGASEEDLSDKPPYVRDDPSTGRRASFVSRQQLRSLLSVDDLVDRTFQTMTRLGEDAATLSVFMSDNGYHWGEHGLIGKGTPYVESTRIPLMLRWPGQIAKGGVDHRLVANIDLFPTILEVAGISLDDGSFDGRSLLGTEERDRLLLEHWAGGSGDEAPTWAGLVTDVYQYVEYYSTDSSTMTFREYYDLELDPAQGRNLLGDGDPSNDPNVAPISLQLDQDRSCRGSACP